MIRPGRHALNETYTESIQNLSLICYNHSFKPVMNNSECKNLNEVPFDSES